MGKAPNLTSRWVIEWHGYNGDFAATDTVYITEKNKDGLTLHTDDAKSWPTREEAVKWAKKHIRNRAFGDPSWETLCKFVQLPKGES